MIKALIFGVVVVNYCNAQSDDDTGGKEDHSLSVTAWVFIGVGIVLVPIGIILLAVYLERKFGIP